MLFRVTGQEQFQLGSLSHYINTRASGYHELPQFPDVAPSAEERNVPEPSPPTTANASLALSDSKEAQQAQKQSKKKKSFYSESDSSPPDG